MFEKSLNDLVRGIRAHKGQEAQYISQCMAEIKKELKQENAFIKANAVSKLTYLQMLGYDISWAAFNLIEVMSSTKFTFKRMGYLAATQSFHENLDVVMLTTNLIKKDLSSANMYDAGLALNGLACFMTPDLARDLANDVLVLTSSSKPYLRKKAILTMYKVFLKFPDALRPAFPRLKERLEDPDSGVQCAAVSVVCELARKNPKNYLSLAPTFFKLMTSSTNNWMLIKIIKLFGALTPLEPRLGKKLIEPLTSLIHSTTAMSLLYECIATVISGMPNHAPSMQLCVTKLKLFVEDTDQNLKYLGLQAMSKILVHQPKAVLQHKDLIVECLDDRDESIRRRALDLISGMVTKKSLPDIVKKLMNHMNETESASYRDEILSKVISICSQGSYQHVTNFEWYLTVLVEMIKFEGTKKGQEIAAQMLDVTIRVKDVRPFAVKQMLAILSNTHLFTGGSQKEGVCEVLYAAAWIVGEFCEHVADPRIPLDILLNPKVTALPGHIQAVFIQNIIKLYASILVKAEAEGNVKDVEDVGGMLVEKLPVFLQSSDLEVQERACCIIQLMKYIVKLQEKGASVATELKSLFAGELNPVAPKAQKKVPVPEGLDLDKWINEPPSEEVELKLESLDSFLDSASSKFESTKSQQRGISHLDIPPASDSPKLKKKGKKEEEEEDEETKKHREQRLQDQQSNPNYLKETPKSLATKKGPLVEPPPHSDADLVTIPVKSLDLGIPLVIEETSTSQSKKKGKKGKKGKRGKKGEESEEEVVVSRPKVDARAGEMPEGARSSGDEEGGKEGGKDVFKQLDVDLDAPLRDDEALPVRRHREVIATGEEEGETKKKKKDSKKKKGKHHKDGEEEDEEGGDKAPKEVEAPGEKTSSPQVKAKKEHKKSSKKAKGGDALALVDVGSASATPVVAPVEDLPPVKGEVPKDQMDDLEFWLTDSKAAAPKEEPKLSPPQAPKVEKKTEEVAKKTELSTKTESPESKPKEKHSKKGKEKGKKKSKSKANGEVNEVAEPSQPAISTLLDFDLGPAATAPVATRFKPLVEDDNLKMTYEVRANPLFNGQVTVAVVFSNKTSDQLVSLDFNVLDSLSTKLDRPVGVSPHDGVPVPFILLPGMANECHFTFQIQTVTVPQKLRGTTTYMRKLQDGTHSDKVDFKVEFPCSSFICPVSVGNDEFAKLLSSGSLCETKSLKAALSKTANYDSALAAIASGLHLVVLEQIENSASLHGISVANHHVCLLVKSAGDGSVAINAKCGDATLMSNLLDEVKAFL